MQVPERLTSTDSDRRSSSRKVWTMLDRWALEAQQLGLASVLLALEVAPESVSRESQMVLIPKESWRQSLLYLKS